MTKQEKTQFIDDLTQKLMNANSFYLADISNLNSEDTSKLRRLCFNKNISINVVKNTLLKKAMDKVEGKNYEGIYNSLKGNTSIMFSENTKEPANLILEFRKKSKRPLLKGAYIDEAIFIGDDQLDALSKLKSREELIGDIILLLQSPAKNVVSALQSGKTKLAGIVKTLSDRTE
jgi:large subunit ribosomal protein L10